MLELREHIGAIRKPLTPSSPARSRHDTARASERWAPWLLLVAALLLWEVVCRGFSVSEFIFPSPSRIVDAALASSAASSPAMPGAPSG